VELTTGLQKMRNVQCFVRALNVLKEPHVVSHSEHSKCANYKYTVIMVSLLRKFVQWIA
jgi:hypothetical protein